MGILQLVLYFMYRKEGIMAEPHKPDIENSGEKTKQQWQSMDTEDNNGKVWRIGYMNVYFDPSSCLLASKSVEISKG